MTNLLTIDLRPDGPLYDRFTVEGLRDVGVSEEIIATAEMKAQAQPIKDECGARIYAVASAAAQRNMSIRLGLIGAKTASSRSAEEAQMLDYIQAAYDWKDAMVTQVTVLLADSSLDFRDDANWPAPSADVLATVEQF